MFLTYCSRKNFQLYFFFSGSHSQTRVFFRQSSQPARNLSGGTDAPSWPQRNNGHQIKHFTSAHVTLSSKADCCNLTNNLFCDCLNGNNKSLLSVYQYISTVSYWSKHLKIHQTKPFLYRKCELKPELVDWFFSLALLLLHSIHQICFLAWGSQVCKGLYGVVG